MYYSFAFNFISDITRLWRHLQDLDLIRKIDNRGDEYSDDYVLTDKGMMLLRKYGSYSNYLNEIEKPERKKEQIERNDRRIKNIGILATLGVSLLTLFLTQCPKHTDQQQKKTEEGIRSIERKLDSLSQVLKPLPMQQGNRAAKDTATSK